MSRILGPGEISFPVDIKEHWNEELHGYPTMVVTPPPDHLGIRLTAIVGIIGMVFAFAAGFLVGRL